VRILYISGYPGAELDKRGMSLDPARILSKPCSHATLARKVREALDESAAR
jgi:hypothetical protein